MVKDEITLEKTDVRRRWRLIIILLLALAVTAGHFWTPSGGDLVQVLHVVLRKLYFLPVILAAIWFNLRGGILASILVTVLYSLHIHFQWSGQRLENINQIGEIVTIWIIAILSGRFIQSEKQALHEVAKTHEGALLALVTALDVREHETGLHSLRVQRYAGRLARELRVSRHDLRILGQASLLHDVGKMGTPDHILLKPDPLNDDEWQIMRQHSEIGRRLLSSVPFLTEAAEIVYCHHERFDGGGYPCGLRREQIPLLARIFALVDVYDALTTDRPYHAKISHDAAQAVLRNERGRHFDPNVVDAFLRIPCSEWQRIAHQADKGYGR